MSAEVFVHVARSRTNKPKSEQHALFVAPEMKLLEEPSAFLDHLMRSTPSTATLRNNAFALSYWHNFCLAVDEDWRHASLDDLIDYKVALETSVSPQTGRRRTTGTVEQYLGPVVEFYDYARSKGWYSGDIQKEVAPRRGRPARSDALAHTRKGAIPTKRRSPVATRSRDSGTMIKPLAIGELRKLLDVLGSPPSEAESSNSGRDRLMVDWLWATGLRVSELLSLEVRQFLSISLDDAGPWSHFPVTVIGKGNKRRRIAVPTWLIEETLAYIRVERAQHVAKYDASNSPGKLFVGKGGSTRCGEPITVRRVEAVLAAAYLAAGLSRYEERFNPDNGRTTLALVPSHCVHDLRHTYAVLTYHAEVANGNNEPWKKIQSQLGHASLATTTGIYLEYVNAHNEFRHASVRDLIGLPRQ
jgi:integrase